MANALIINHRAIAELNARIAADTKRAATIVTVVKGAK